MTVKGGTSPACAACKYQRRRCSSQCQLAPYFPATDTHIFQNAHKLFGVSKIMRILKNLNSQVDKDNAMKSIIYESNLREMFPVGGCVEFINQLQQQLIQSTQDLHHARTRLAICKEEGEDQVREYVPSAELHLGMIYGSNPSSMSMLSNGMLMPYEMGHYAINENNKGVYFDCEDELVKQLCAQDLNYNNGVDDQIAIQMQMQMQHSQAYQSQQETEMDYNDMPFDSMACDSSCGSAWKDTRENVSRNYELKNAAACFTLTSVN